MKTDLTYPLYDDCRVAWQLTKNIDGFELEHTGGGCVAWQYEKQGEFICMITDANADMPTRTDILIGFYSPEDDYAEACEWMGGLRYFDSIKEAREYLEEWFGV